MTLENRLSDAFAELEELEPSVDLWARVNRSIEQDRAHRRRLRVTIALVALAILALVGVGWLLTVETALGRVAVEWRSMELIETVALVAFIATLGPAVRRFGDGYAGIIFRAHPQTGERFVRLLDVAYYLLFTGYVLATSDFERPIEASLRLGSLIEAGLGRLGGLLLVMGVLHAATFIGLPVVGLVFTATWHDRPLSRWFNRPRPACWTPEAAFRPRPPCAKPKPPFRSPAARCAKPAKISRTRNANTNAAKLWWIAALPRRSGWKMPNRCSA